MLYRESTQTHTYVVKVGPVSGDIYMYGYMTVSPADYISFARIDSSYNIKYSAAYSGFPNVEAWEVDSAESKIYTLIRPISDFSMAIFNTTDGTNLHIYTSTDLTSTVGACALILDSANTMAILNVNHASGSIAICQFTFSNQKMNWMLVSGTTTPNSIAIISSTSDLFYTAIIPSSLIFQRTKYESV